ncbi:MAG: hypothetical protein LLG04_18905 [Parachlamydia sp.]|nr:hypothetical protein [Parachlamydia sp.]
MDQEQLKKLEQFDKGVDTANAILKLIKERHPNINEDIEAIADSLRICLVTILDEQCSKALFADIMSKAKCIEEAKEKANEETR